MSNCHLLPRSIVALSFVFASASVFAHDTWLLPLRDAGETIAFEFTSGMDFPNADYAIKPDRIATRGCRVAGATCELATGKSGEHALLLSAKMDRSAAGVLWIDLAPKTLSLDADKVEEYLAEIDPPASVRAAYMAQAEPRHWRETYVKHAKALTGSAGETPTAWSKPVGSELEIIPSAISLLTRNSNARFQVLSGGKPLADFAIGVVGGSNAKPRLLRTDGNGEVELPIDGAGYWMLRVTQLTPSTTKNIDWDSHFATLTFDVR
ncbi:MAG: DUF4198 domain-containing protein [Dokdonella sp.]